MGELMDPFTYAREVSLLLALGVADRERVQRDADKEHERIARERPWVWRPRVHYTIGPAVAQRLVIRWGSAAEAIAHADDEDDPAVRRVLRMAWTQAQIEADAVAKVHERMEMVTPPKETTMTQAEYDAERAHTRGDDHNAQAGEVPRPPREGEFLRGSAPIEPYREPARARTSAPAQQPAATPPALAAGPRMSEQTDVLFRELAAAQLEFGEVVKKREAVITKGATRYTYRYANLVDVCAAIMPALTKHGIVPVQIPMGNRVYVRIVHGPSGQWIEGGLPLVLPDHGADVQRMGSALTYVRRYLLCTMLGVVAAEDEDDDGQRA